MDVKRTTENNQRSPQISRRNPAMRGCPSKTILNVRSPRHQSVRPQPGLRRTAADNRRDPQAEPAEGRRGKRGREGAGPEPPVIPRAEPPSSWPCRIEAGRDPGIRRAHQRQALFDRAHPRRREVLTRPGRIAEPGVVRDVDEPRGPVAASIELSPGIDRLVADQRRRPPASPGRRNVRGPGPPAKPPPGTTWTGSGIPARLKFAERHEVPFVVRAADCSVRQDRDQAVAGSVARSNRTLPTKTGRPPRPGRSPPGPRRPLEQEGLAVSGHTTTFGPGPASATP